MAWLTLFLQWLLPAHDLVLLRHSDAQYGISLHALHIRLRGQETPARCLTIAAGRATCLSLAPGGSHGWRDVCVCRRGLRGVRARRRGWRAVRDRSRGLFSHARRGLGPSSYPYPAPLGLRGRGPGLLLAHRSRQGLRVGRYRPDYPPSLGQGRGDHAVGGRLETVVAVRAGVLYVPIAQGFKVDLRSED